MQTHKKEKQRVKELKTRDETKKHTRVGGNRKRETQTQEWGRDGWASRVGGENSEVMD